MPEPWSFLKAILAPGATVKTATEVRRVRQHVFNAGYVIVGGAHELYYEEWGKPDGIVVMVLHGGPGASFNETHKALFDPSQHRVVLFDQRGCGQSKPLGQIANNTTSDLIKDIDQVRAKVGISTPMNLAGGSWGSTLALLYAQHRPETVKELMLWSTFLGSKEETYAPLGTQTKDGKFPHPGSWRRFIRLVPRQYRRDPAAIIAYALGVFNSMDTTKAWELAVAYNVYDLATCNSPTFDEAKARADAENDPAVIHAARVQMHYFHHLFFIQERLLLDQIGRIRGIKASVVHGLDDWCTRPKASADLQKAYGPNMSLKYVKSGHLRSDPEMKKALQAIALGFS